MYVPLTDFVTCPRCGPEWRLVLLADRTADRRVLAGRFGCPNCRESFAVESGFADLGGEADAGAPAPAAAPSEDSEAAVRLAALLGLGSAPGFPLLVGSPARLAPALAALVDGLEVVAVDPSLRAWPETPGVSRFAAGDRLPFRDRCMHGVAVGGEAAATLLEEAARVLGASARLVVEDAPEDADSRLAAAGFSVVARDGRTLVARRERAL